MKWPRRLSAANERDLREYDALRIALGMRPSDQVLHLFSAAYANACERYEKANGASEPITFTVVRAPMQEALADVFRFYLELARQVR